MRSIQFERKPIKVSLRRWGRHWRRLEKEIILLCIRCSLTDHGVGHERNQTPLCSLVRLSYALTL